MKLFGLERERGKTFPIQRKPDGEKIELRGGIVYDVRNHYSLIYIVKMLWACDPIAEKFRKQKKLFISSSSRELFHLNSNW